MSGHRYPNPGPPPPPPPPPPSSWPSRPSRPSRTLRPPPPPLRPQSLPQAPPQEKKSDKKPEDEEGELPSGWEAIFDNRTRNIQYLNHNTNSISSARPSPAVNSTLSQDFTSGIKTVRDFNLRNFSGSVKQTVRNLTTPASSVSRPPLRPPVVRPPPRPPVILSSRSKGIAFLPSRSLSPSPSLSPSLSPIDSRPPLASPIIVGDISSLSPLGDQPKPSSPELESLRNSGGSKMIHQESRLRTEQRALIHPETLVYTETEVASVQIPPQHQGTRTDSRETRTTSKSSKRVLESIEQDKSPHQDKRLKASARSLSGSPSLLISPDAANDSIPDHITNGVLTDQNIGDAAHHITLHLVECDGSRGIRIYADSPKPSPRIPGHYIGESPIFDVKQYLASFSDLGFAVYKEYSCQEDCEGDGHRRNPKHGDVQMVAKQILKPPLPQAENIAIISPKLRKAIEDVATFPAGKMGSHESDGFLTFSKPYEFFFHHISQLEGIRQSLDTVTNSHVGWLLDHILETVGEVFEAARDLFAQGLVSDECLPYLFCPNELVIFQENGIYIAAILKLSQRSTELASLLTCWTWGPPTSSGMERKSKYVTLEDIIQGDRVKITELKSYPARFASKEVIDLIKKRGQAFWNLRHPILVSYSGWDFQSERKHVDTRFMIDYSTYRKMHPFAPIFAEEKARLKDRGVKTVDNRHMKLRLDEDPIDESLMLLPPNVHGFDMQEKKWFNLSVDNVKEVEWNVEAFKLLVLPKPTKDLIQALIEIRASKEDMSHIMKRQDIMGGKGQGLIMLLHGGPGTGKTLTAGYVAEIAKMPLYRVTCGDIGTNAEEVEKYLQNILYLGKAWNCVLLLDEADIFLEQRSLSDLKRNSLVSVFLRILEYYEGILILTTNRIGTFDEAFRSRIQISLHYAKLSPEFQRRIWQNFFNMLRADGENADLEELEDHLQELSGKDMNGREIRNALATARQLALHKKEILSWRHLDLAIQTAGNFSRYLKDVHGGEAEDLARENRDR